MPSLPRRCSWARQRSTVQALLLVLTLVACGPLLFTAGRGVKAKGQRSINAVRARTLSSEETSKLDVTPDELFYVIPRIGIYHVDDGWRAQLTELYRLLIPSGSDVLDLCSQHDSHLPAGVEYNSLTVHGMNYLELLANQRANSRFTRNFNADPSLRDLKDESLDAVLMAVSIQYMQQPLVLFEEVRRVLRPGGVFVVSFSDRMFFTKAINAWTRQRSMSSLAQLVLSYFTDSGFVGVRAANRVGNVTDMRGNPFLAVVGFRDKVLRDPLEQPSISWLATSGTGSIW